MLRLEASGSSGEEGCGPQPSKPKPSCSNIVKGQPRVRIKPRPKLPKASMKGLAHGRQLKVTGPKPVHPNESNVTQPIWRVREQWDPSVQPNRHAPKIAPSVSRRVENSPTMVQRPPAMVVDLPTVLSTKIPDGIQVSYISPTLPDISPLTFS